MHAVAMVEDYADFRLHARRFLAANVAPHDATWQSGEASLFTAAEVPPPQSLVRIPRELAGLLEEVACHADPQRWPLMYRVLWRIVRGGERALLSDPADGDVARLRRMAKAVSHEVHKMHAFVRFRETRDDDGQPLYVAWFEPQHDIVRRAVPFFVDRFAGMRWAVVTPMLAARWDGAKLEYVPGPHARPQAQDDGREALWRTYYASIFNPARLNERMMAKEMPRRYWKNLPETQVAAKLAREAPVRVARMNAAQTDRPSWSAKVSHAPAKETSLDRCRDCPLWQRATQAVPGEGPKRAAIMLVGEQPGDEEDLKGRPFVGPAGKVLEKALAEAGLERSDLYLTNAVKHFKWEPRGKRRLHKTPAQREIEACNHWLEGEIAAVRPRVIVAMGATALLAITGYKHSIASVRGQGLRHAGGALVVPTYHPSAVLRSQDDGERIYEALCEDLLRADGHASRLSTPDAEAREGRPLLRAG